MNQLFTPPLPKYRQHKARNLAVVTLSGRDYNLGRYNSPESRTEYQRLASVPSTLNPWV